MAQFHAWYDSQPFADQAAVAPWLGIPAELQQTNLGWNSAWAADVDRIVNNPKSFTTADELGLFIEQGIHNQFLHGAAQIAFNEPMLGSFHSPLSTYFYQLHGLVDHWWQLWTRAQAWSDIKAVPGWFGWENQGAGAAVGDISGNGRPDLVVFHVDNPEGDNHGYYRIGWNLDTGANVTGGWSDIKAVPDWFGWENQGAGISLWDISGNGRPDLVVFHVDNPEGENHGYYRIGWDLDVNGNVTGGWSDIKAVPDWFGAENQGADCTIADISRNGRPDLVVFHVDNPDGDNHGYYRIGWDLDTGGNVAGGWSDIKAVPDWFGWENQGAGVTIADLHGHGGQDLLVFHIDNPEGENHGYYRMGWDLDTGGNVTGGWSDIKAVPDWFGAEDQGAGAALADIRGTGARDLLVFHVDNPGGDNHGYYRIGWGLNGTGDVTG